MLKGNDAMFSFNKNNNKVIMTVEKKLTENYEKDGIYFYENGKFDEAVLQYNQAIILNPKNAVLYEGRAYCFYQLGKFDKAISDYNTAITLDPNYATYYGNRGYCFFEQDNFDKAINNFNKAITLDSNNDDYYNMRGNCFYHKLNYDEAIKDFNQAITLNPHVSKYYHNYGYALYCKNKFKLAKNNFNKAINLNLFRSDTYMGRGSCFFQLGQFNEAIDDCHQACKFGEEGNQKINEAIKKANDGLVFLQTLTEEKDFRARRNLIKTRGNCGGSVQRRANKLRRLKQQHDLDFHLAQAYLMIAPTGWLSMGEQLSHSGLITDVYLHITYYLLVLSMPDSIPDSIPEIKKVINTYNERITTRIKGVGLSRFKMGLFTEKQFEDDREQVINKHYERKRIR